MLLVTSGTCDGGHADELVHLAHQGIDPFPRRALNLLD